MSTVSIKNNTSNNIAFEARILTMQGQHVTVRASLPATLTTVVPLPNGVTAEMLAEAPEVKAEQAKPAPNWSVVSVDSKGVQGLSDYEVFRSVAAAASATLALGCAQRNMKLAKLRVSGVTASGAGESFTVSDIKINGVSKLPVAQQVALPQNTAAYTDVSGSLSGSWTEIKEGDFVEAVVTYVAGAATLTTMAVEVVGLKS